MIYLKSLMRDLLRISLTFHQILQVLYPGIEKYSELFLHIMASTG